MSGRRGAGRAGSGAGRGCRQLGSGRLTGAGGAHRDAGAVRDGEVGIERVTLIHGLLPTLDLVADLRGRQRHLRHRAPSVRRTTGGERKWRIVPRALLLLRVTFQNTQNFVSMVQQTGRSPGPNNARVTRPLRAHVRATLANDARSLVVVGLALREHVVQEAPVFPLPGVVVLLPERVPLVVAKRDSQLCSRVEVPRGVVERRGGLRGARVLGVLELVASDALEAVVGFPGAPWAGGWFGQRWGKRKSSEGERCWFFVGFRLRKRSGRFTFWGRGRRGRWAGRTGA